MENIELTQVKKAIGFINLLATESHVNSRNILGFLKRFGDIYNEKKAELPYHINLIEELHADENAHSRIFAQLLRYEKKGKYSFLEKFLNSVCPFDLIIETPKVERVDSCGRIDIPIFDNKYVVVIENKVTDKAADQNGEKGGQLARYIETIKDYYGKKLEEIYVVYTPKYTREPSDDCWISKDDFSYKDNFKDRFCSLSYRDVIYPWLKNRILPDIEKKDIYLSSAVIQYLDHLEGMFSLREIDKNMNMELQEFIKTELGLNGVKPEDATAILSEKETELNSAINQIQLLRKKYQKEVVDKRFKEWEEMLKADFYTFKIVGNKFELDKEIINVGVEFVFENQSFVAQIECNNYNKPNIYFGIGRCVQDTKKIEMPAILQEILKVENLNNVDDLWYGWEYTTLEDAYLRLKNLIKKINKIQK